MTTLSIARYMGANTFSAMDAAGTIFWCYQGPNDRAVVMMEKEGKTTDVTPAGLGLGRPSLDCNPTVGLWAIGNKQGGGGVTPPRLRIKEYVPFSSGGLPPPVSLPADNPIWQLYRGTYAPEHVDTPQEVALRVSKQLAALNEVIDILVKQGLIVRA